MILTHPFLFFLPFLILFSPVPFFIIWALIRQRQRRASAAADATAPKPFAPDPAPTPGEFLRRFDTGERIYLRLQAKTARGGFFTVLWLLLSMLLPSLLPAHVRMYGTLAGQPEQVWYSFLQGASMMSGISLLMGIFTALIANIGVLGSPRTALNRTRPLSHAFLFWARLGPALLTLFSGYIVSLGFAFVVLLAAYGPVWKHLDSQQPVASVTAPSSPVASPVTAKPPNSEDPDDPAYDEPAAVYARHHKWLAVISPSRIFISFATSMTLLFCGFTALMTFPWQRIGGSLPKPLLLLPGVFSYFLFFRVFRNMYTPNTSSSLFFYNAIGPAPAWHQAILPVALSVILLLAARAFFSRMEV